MNKCICGKELTGRQTYCSDKCRKRTSRTNSDNKNAPELDISPKVGQVGHDVPPQVGQIPDNSDTITSRTEEVGQEINIPDCVEDIHKLLPEHLKPTSDHFAYPNGAHHKRLVNGQWQSPKESEYGKCKYCGKDLSILPKGHLLECCYDCAIHRHTPAKAEAVLC